MCGITGIVRKPTAAAIDRAVLERMTGTLRHRGPDGDGFFLNRNVGLGHRRLSIIDLAGGDQPIFNEDRSVVIVFNGEIYNFKELRADLIERGHTFKTHSDTEVIVHLYEDLGCECLHQLNGMFAFALWDAKQELLLLARDRLGEKPLYYTSQGGQMVFGSELKAVVDVPQVSAELDPYALDDYLAYGYVPAPRTIFKDISKLPAAHRVVWRAGQIEVSRYWSPDDERVCVSDRPEEAAAQLRSLLDDSVRIRLRSDVPVGAFLSGGIDSSLIVALASRQAATPLQTFTVTFAEQEYDESPYAALVAKHCGTEHREIPIGEVDLSILPDLVRQFDEPFADPSAVPTYFVTREASRFVKVCLSGDGGDELFGGYRRYRWETFEKAMNHVPAQLRRATLGAVARSVPPNTPGRGWLLRMASNGAERLQQKVGIFDPDERLALLNADYRAYVNPEPHFIDHYYRAAQGTELEKRMIADRHTYLPEDVLTKVDRDSMANSLEVRVPLLDHRVVAFAQQLDFSLKISNTEQKVVLKQVLDGLVPNEILSRGKRGFGIPLRRWLNDGKLDDSLSLLTSSDSRAAEFLEPSQVRRLVDAHSKHGRDMSGRIWALLWLEHWCRLFR
jgi:asparagine synthase (glutamine-hydrolysing)